jgi:hypothetical protein
MERLMANPTPLPCCLVAKKDLIHLLRGNPTPVSLTENWS